MGRPSILTSALTEKICGYILGGSYIETACAACGIHKDTLFDWLKRGAKDRNEGRKSKHRDFSDSIEKTLAQAELRDVYVIDRAANGDKDHAPQWQAAAWKLERRFMHRWGRKDRTEVTGKDGGPIQTKDASIDASKLEPGEARTLLALIRKTRAVGDDGEDLTNEEELE